MKKIIMYFMALALCLTGCGAEPSISSEAETVVSNVSAEDCFLCGNGAEEPFYWGQNNVGIISLNTFEVMPLAINRYDNDGVFIAEHTGAVQFRSHESQGNGFYAHLLEDPDGSYARGEVSFYEDETLDGNKTASFLCQDCLDKVLPEPYKEAFGVGVINFATREIQAFEKNHEAFGLGDYYIDCDWNEPDGPEDSWAVDILVFYRSPRYAGDE